MGHHDPLADFGMPVLYLADTNVHCLRFDKTDFGAASDPLHRGRAHLLDCCL